MLLLARLTRRLSLCFFLLFFRANQLNLVRAILREEHQRMPQQHVLRHIVDIFVAKDAVQALVDDLLRQRFPRLCV